MPDEGDLFGDSSDDADTDDLLASTKSSKPVAKKKGDAKKKAVEKDDKPDADNDLDDSDDDEDFNTSKKDNAGGGLFDSSDEEDDDGGAPKKLGGKKRAKKPKAATSSAKPSNKKDKMSMKERMEALAKRRHAESGADGGAAASLGKDEKGGKEPKKKRSKTDKDGKSRSGGDKGDKKEKGYESGDSYDSVNFERTKEDDDFIDADDEDPDALKELYSEQHFEDERPDGSDSEEEGKKKRKGAAAKRSGGGKSVDKLSDDEGDIDEKADATSALKAAVKRMAKKKAVKRGLNELEDEAREFLGKMDAAADADDEAIAARKPATKKLAMLPQVMEMLAKKDMVRPLLDLDLLSVCKRWVQPLPNGSLGNVTLRHRVIEAISTLTGETGVNAGDLKRSGFGKVVMALYMHKSETPAMKKILKNLIEQWSRPIFQKSGNMRDLERVQATRGRNESGIVGIAMAQKQMDSQRNRGSSASAAGRGRNEDDLKNIISGTSKSSNDLGNNRVRVPYSKGFQFTVRPQDRTGSVADKRNLVSNSKDGEKRGTLSKRMQEKQRPTNKQSQRSANISIEGRAVK